MMPVLSANPQLPTGTVTFLFTDIEGSTKLAQQFPDVWPIAQSRHHAILQNAITTHHGYVFRTIGDEFNVAFATALDALAAALAAQRALYQQPWGETGQIRVRMGLHTGTATPRADEYEGYLTLSHTKRLMSAAYGGQILLSQATEALLLDPLPQGVTLRDLGEYRLKDFDRAEHIFQVIAPDLPADFPPLPLAAFPNNLPAQLTSFIGRKRELAEIKQLLTTTHLLTVTGPGGTGKTRLALQLAADVLETFADGVWLVELAPLADPTLVTQTVASTLGVREQPRRTLLDALIDYVRAKTMLLILDNCEHLIETCAQIADTLLRAAPRLKILASSREALGIAGETAYRVPSLPLPDPRQLHDLDALVQNDCVHLFMDRALAAYPHFRLKEKNAPAIADICLRLDGIPLAIELAAARTKVFPAEEIAARLDDLFRTLTGGSRTALERHQTLEALIDWSYDLLSEAEQVLLRRLSVFAGGWSFDAAQAVCSDGLGNDVLDLLTHLVDKSLVAVEAEMEEGRYRLLETIRQYARGKLFKSGESEQMRDHHLEFFLRFAEETEPKLRSAEQIEWLERVETEHDNLRTALGWSLESGKSDRSLQLAGALAYFWELRGYFSEGHKWLDQALALSERERSEKVAVGETRAETARRAKALYGIGMFRFGVLSDPAAARTTVEESLRLWRELGDKWWMAGALARVGLILQFEGDIQTALARLEEGVLLAREVEDPWPLAVCLIRLGDGLKGTDVAAARRVLEEGVALARNAGDKSVLSDGLRELGPLYYLEGDLTAAARVTEEALAEARAIGSLIYVFLALLQLVIISSLQNDPAKAKGCCSELWALGRETGSPLAFLFALLAFGFVAIFSGQPGRGVRLLVALEALARQRGMKFNVEGEPTFMMYKQALEKAQAQLGPAGFETAMGEGRALTLEQAIALATENEGEDSRLPKAGPGASSD